MTASASPVHPGADATRHTGMRVVVAVTGLATIAVGVVLLFNPVGAARTLALLMGLAFVLGGLLEIAVGWDSEHRWTAVVPGGILVVGGLLAVAWPEITLWTIAVLTGFALITHGVGRVVLAVAARHEVPGWPWLALAGAFGILFGLVALVWPQATVLVLSLVLGAEIVVLGVLLLAAAFAPPGLLDRS